MVFALVEQRRGQQRAMDRIRDHTGGA